MMKNFSKIVSSVVIGSILTHVCVNGTGLQCEVSFQSRIWFPDSVSPSEVTNMSSPARQDIPCGDLSGNTTEVHSEVSQCVFLRNHNKAAAIGCGQFAYQRPCTGGAMLEIVVRDCVGHIRTLPKEGICETKSWSQWADEGIYLFYSEQTFPDHLSTAGITETTPLVSCFCKTEKCNNMPVGGQLIQNSQGQETTKAISAMLSVTIFTVYYLDYF